MKGGLPKNFIIKNLVRPIYSFKEPSRTYSSVISRPEGEMKSK